MKRKTPFSPESLIPKVKIRKESQNKESQVSRKLYYREYRSKMNDEKKKEYQQKSNTRLIKFRLKQKDTVPKQNSSEEALKEMRSILSEDTSGCVLQQFQNFIRKQKKNLLERKKRASEHWKTRDARCKKRKIKRVEQQQTTHSQPQQTTHSCPSSNIQPPVPNASGDARTPAAQRKARSRVKKVLPHSPRKYASTLVDVWEHSSPRKKDELNKYFNRNDMKLGLLAKKTLAQLKRKRDKQSKCVRDTFIKCLVTPETFNCTRNLLGFDRRTMTNFLKRKKEQKKTKKEKRREEAEKFFVANSVPLPDKKLVSKKSGLHAQQLQVMS